jgi:hypothetical protein
MEELLCTTAQLAHEGSVVRTGIPPAAPGAVVWRSRREVHGSRPRCRRRSPPWRGTAERYAPAPAIA